MGNVGSDKFVIPKEVVYICEARFQLFTYL